MKTKTKTKTKKNKQGAAQGVKTTSKRTNKLCNGLTFEECELAILRIQVDKAEKIAAKQRVNSEGVQKILDIVKDFIVKRKMVAYGGFAIDQLLPDKDKIYNKDIDLPDYDMFSQDALHDAKDLGNIYYNAGYEEVEVRSGKHYGTYKVFVNFLPVADVTNLPKELFDAIKKQAHTIDGMMVADPNLLRMSMYLELSRPNGEVDRFEKVLKRLILINKHYPLAQNAKCKEKRAEFQRSMEDKRNKTQEEDIYLSTLNALVARGVVFFGGYAIMLYSKYMPDDLRGQLKQFPDFDVLSEEPEETAHYVKSQLEEAGFHGIKIIEHTSLGELIPKHYEICVGRDTIAFIYKPIACHSYNVINLNKKKIKVATIDTMLSFYLAFLYNDRPYYNKDRILCMAKFLFDVQQQNRLKQTGLLKRFSINCYGHQETLEEMRAARTEKFKQLKNQMKNNKRNPEYEKWFLNYVPANDPANKRIKYSRKRGKVVGEEREGEGDSQEHQQTHTVYESRKKGSRKHRGRRNKKGFFNW